ncbi:MAG: hypothetical protein ACRDZ6_06385 [Acidimicrobiales bacterium]
MAFDVTFAIFAALLLVLVVFVIRFAVQLSRRRDADGMTLRERAYARAQARAGGAKAPFVDRDPDGGGDRRSRRGGSGGREAEQ